MQYIKQLDTVRAFAVSLVIISHWIPADNPLNIFPNGMIGVTLFFVLSGFLITRILLDARRKIEAKGWHGGRAIKSFYWRRSLRIFPIYYLVLILLWIFSAYIDTDMNTAFGYYASYTTNFYFYRTQDWHGSTSHLWSLAVEEQFYLIWPWIILFVNRRQLLSVIVIFILIGAGSQLIMARNEFSGLLPFTCLDSFGLGALLSLYMRNPKLHRTRFYKGLFIACILSAGYFIYGFVTETGTFIPQRTLISIISLRLIAYVVANHDRDRIFFHPIFSNRIMIYLGKISYGLYLYHNIIGPTITSKIIDIYLNPLLPDLLYRKHWAELYLAENSILLIMIASASYFCIEKPFLKLKKYYQYD